MKYLALLLVLCLTACQGADGRTYLFLTAEEVLGYYVSGVVDVCMEDAREEMMRSGVPLTTLNVQAALQRCEDKAHRLLLDRGSDIVPESMPSLRPSGKGNL